MKLLSAFSLLAALFLHSSVLRLPAAPPSRLTLPPSISAAGAPVTVGPAQWGLVVWNVTSPDWLATRDIAVYLKPAAADVSATYTLQGVMTPLRDPGAIKPWIARAVSIGGNTAELNEACERLHRLWRNPAVPEALPAALEDRISMLAGRAASRPEGAAALRQLGNSYPLFRFVTATGWAGPLGVAAGQTATIELRERDRASGTEGAVVGRVSIVAGAPDVLAAPGAPVFVRPPFLTSLPAANEQPLAIPGADQWPDLAIPLRWAVPESLRRQILLTRGFHVWRLTPGYTPPGGLTPSGLAATAPLAQKKRLTRNPAAATKLYRPTGSPETGPDVSDLNADPATWFLTDDNGRYDFVSEPAPGQPPVISGVPYAESERWDYIVGTVDLLGRISSVSPRLTNVPPCRTVPPTVPKALRVENIMKSGNQRLRVVWKPNANTTTEVSTTHYLIFRDRIKNTPGSTATTDKVAMPDRQDELIYLGVVPHSAGTNGELSFDDDALVPGAADYGQTYFYSIRAAHLGPCGYNCSAPGPPVFGTLRDRLGPAAPTGYLAVECPRVSIKRNPGTVITAPLNITGNQIVVRARATRADKGVEWVSFDSTYTAGSLPPVQPEPVRLYFGNSDTVWRDIVLPSASRDYGIIAIAGTAAGRISHTLTTDESNLDAGKLHEITFTARTGNLIDMTPPDSSGPWREYFIFSNGVQTVSSFTPAAQAEGARGSLGSIALNDITVLLQYQHTNGTWVNAATATWGAGSSNFYFDPGTSISRPWRAWRIIDPPGQSGTVCRHEPRPAQKSTVEPVKVTLLMQPGSKEYRLYRKIDEGALFLLKQGVGTWDSSVVQAVVLEDNMLPPAGGRIGYFGQTFDEHGNPSPLALLDEKIGVLPKLPVPVLDIPVSEGTLAAPKIRIKATCPGAGVERIEILLNPPPEATSGIVTIGDKNALLFNFKAGTTVSGAQAYGSSLAADVATLSGPSQPFTLNRQLNIKAATKYTLQVRALGADGYSGDWSAPQEFTWQEPVAAGEVPWPARPLPGLQTWNSGITARTLTSTDFVASPAPSIRVIYPGTSLVYVRIGSFGLSGSPGNLGNWNVFGTQVADDYFIGNLGYYQTSGSQVVNPADLPASAPRRYLYPREIMAGDIATYDFDSSLLPVVLYRQQTGRMIEGAMQAIASADIVQVSPMITGITYTTEAPGGRTFIKVTDPYVLLSARHEPNPYNGSTLQIDMNVADMAPVASGGRYKYWLAHFDLYGEINAIIPAGEVTIP